MWPFNRKKAESEAVQPSPCGQDETHHYWTQEGWSCPCCVSMEEAKRKKRVADEQAENIARRVARILAEQSKGAAP